ncbi:MAG: hypothetical protein M5U01_12200 [Ardenticatenaceae bacterium]|nr:hypothetical protein [Ardenticatenaceae bacterium]
MSRDEEPPYARIAEDTPLGAAIYPFLEDLGRAWTIVAYDLDAEVAPREVDTFGLSEPTLRWVGDDGVSDLYVDGMTTEEFLAATGLELSLAKGGFVLSKRISRIMRPHVVSGFFDAGEVAIRYLDQDEAGKKVWDGAGVISRAMLRKFVLSDEMEPAKRARLERELATVRRVEFTILSERGQDKGHAIVADELPDGMDFLLPRETKREVRLTSGRTFVGISAVHGAAEMRLDIQSVVNLYPFFEPEQLLEWLRQEGDLFLEGIEAGRVNEAMQQIDRHATLEEVTGWHLREFVASGGDVRWFPSLVRTLVDQHLARLNHSTLENLRLPIPGGRLYVMPAAVGWAAGLNGLDVPRGQIQLDVAGGTAWVNDEDWLRLPDSPKDAGIAAILGGADNDDALWLHPFTDHDGERKVLAWRSPNQPGEYLLLRPTDDSDDLCWSAPGGEEISFPSGDSRLLGPRADRLMPDYLGLVDPDTAGGLGEGQEYDVGVVQATVERARANRGALGQYCNALMLAKALFGGLPERPPAPLEDIIDSAVKTGADLSDVRTWCQVYSQELVRKETPVPAILHRRLSVPGRRRASVRATTEHWLDRLLAGVQAHIQAVEARREVLAGKACPPRRLFDGVFDEPEMIELGARFNAVYAGTLNRRKIGAVPQETRLAMARQAAESFLDQFLPERQEAILRGAMVSLAMNDRPGRGDAAVWLGDVTVGGVVLPGGGGWGRATAGDRTTLDSCLKGNWAAR